jgi:LmbE family N-acetylglucosaminyl deacetylase
VRLFEEVDSVIAVVAHPDDAELMFYGTLRSAREAGAAVAVTIVTAGENGVSQSDAPTRQITQGERIAETLGAFDGTGIDVQVLGFGDGEVTTSRLLVDSLESVLRSRECTVLLTHDPSALNDHQDHVAVGRAAANVGWRYPGCSVIAFGQPTQPGAGFHGNLLVDISPFLDDKIASLRSHQSQGGRWYLSEQYTRARSESVGWQTSPDATSSGSRFESLRLVTGIHPSPTGEGKR